MGRGKKTPSVGGYKTTRLHEVHAVLSEVNGAFLEVGHRSRLFEVLFIAGNFLIRK